MDNNPRGQNTSSGSHGHRFSSTWHAGMAFGWVIFLILLCLFVVWQKVTSDQATVAVTPEPTISSEISLSDLDNSDEIAKDSNRTLSVNGQLKLNSSLILNPTTRPDSPVTGQVYYDESTNAPMYYDGTNFVAVARQDDVAALQSAQQQTVRVEPVPQTPSVVVDTPDDIAQTEQANTFTKDNTFMQNFSVNGFSALQSTSIANLLLSQPLGVASGGTGTSSLALNGVVIGGGSGALSSINAGSTGLCLMSTSGAPTFQACPGANPAQVTSTSNAVGTLAKFGASNTLVDSLVSEIGSTVNIAGNINLGLFNVQLGNNGFGSTLNTTALTANRSIVLPNESGTICLQSASSCGFAANSGSTNYIQNQFAGSQANTNFWISGSGVAYDFIATVLQGEYVDVGTGSNEILKLGATNASKVRLGHYGINTEVGGQLVATQGIQVIDYGLILQGNTISYTSPLGTALSTMINIPNYDVPGFGSILSFGLPSTSAATARGMLIADARTVDHQPTLGVLSPNESDIFGLSWDGSNGVARLKTLGASVGIRLGANDVAQFGSAQIYLNQNTNVTGGLQVFGNSVFTPTTDSTDAFRIQGADTSAVLFRADTIGNKIVVRTLDVDYNLTVGGNVRFNGHLRSGGSNPTTVTGPAACTAPTVSVSGTDTSGMVTVVAGTGCASSGAVMAVIFANAFAAAPKVTLTPATSAASTLPSYVDYAQITTTSFDISSSTPLTDGATYRWFYHAIE